ncbi:MAG: sulfatase [Myxococcota bacterium]|nr:sulfatase [Myxococcota bacterium]
MLAAAGLACGGGEPPPDGPTPNIVLVTLDTLRLDHVGAYGGPSAPGAPAGLTPNLDRLAARGLVHENAFTTMPTTGPAHLSLFTGLLPSRHGGRANAVPLALRMASRELAGRLVARGYTTAAFTTTTLLTPRLLGVTGFQVFDAPGGGDAVRNEIRPGEEAVDAALDWLADTDRRPVFLWVHLYDPHAPYGRAADKRRALPVAPEAHGWVDRERFDEAAERTRMAALYGDGVRDMDDALGTLLAGLERRLRSGLVVVVADHGESLDEHLETRGYAYDHGEFLEPETVRIPLVLAGPGVAPGRSAGAASIRDLYTTLLLVAGAEDPDAAREGRRDLRRASEARRVVVIERRAFATPQRPEVTAHAVAASDGEHLLVLAEDGSITSGREPAAGGLAAAARGRRRVPPPEAPLPDAETRRALEALGYAE